jgi:Bacterial regulatory protein, arsR family.
MNAAAMDPRVRMAKAESNPVRFAILNILRQRVASPTELSKELGVSMSLASNHVKVLKEYDCIELVKTKPRRGALEHFYRAKAELATAEPGIELSQRQRKLLAELIDDTLYDPDAPSYTAAERDELVAVLIALGQT